MTDPFEPTQPTQPTQPAQSTQPGVSFPPTQPRPSDPFASSSPTGIPNVGVGDPQMAAVGSSPRRRSGAATFVNVLLGVALVVAVGGVAFAAGRATAPAPATANRTGFGGNGGNGQFFGPNASGAPNRGGGFAGFGGAGGVAIQGTVTAVSADSISLQLASGQTVTIPLDSQTTYHSRTPATASQVTDGATVIVQLSGAGRGAFGGGNGAGNGQGQGGGQGPTASGAPGRALGSASSITIVPSGT